ncbi:unnamed protein product [Somion occarium]|uniref:DUF726-domain-containing protein n=1 Tax=Somion occarium TaxID=3059160 RepID=A0ABP1DCR2_9APHY
MKHQKSDLTKIVPPKELDETARSTIFLYFMRRLASHRNSAELYAYNEYGFSMSADGAKARDAFVIELDHWAQELLKNAWNACQEPGNCSCPTLDPLSDTSIAALPPLPAQEHVVKVLHTILFLHITTRKEYHAHTRAFLFSLAPINEDAVAETLKDPASAVEEAERKTKAAKDKQASRGKTLRNVGMGLGAVAGGVLIGVTGGLAAPLVGAGVTSVLGWLGVGGTAAGLLASGLASSSIVCGALFGAYGSKKTAEIVGRYTREIRDLAIVPVREPKNTLAVRLCVSGWLDSQPDVVAPWTIFEDDDTFALQWEVDALIDLSNALTALIKSQAMKYVKAEVIKRTVLASLFAALAPAAWLKIAQLIDNPWMNAKTLALKAGKVLGILLEQRVLGNRPVTLVGYSLGSLVIFEALQHLASLPPKQSAHLVQDVYLFGAPVSTDQRTWSAARRVTAGRLVNGYGTDDYVLALLSRMSSASWNVAGITNVDVQGVENVACEGVDGHLKWRGMIGKSLESCNAPGLCKTEVELQVEKRAKEIEQIVDLSPADVDAVLQEGPNI